MAENQINCVCLCEETLDASMNSIPKEDLCDEQEWEDTILFKADEEEDRKAEEEGIEIGEVGDDKDMIDEKKLIRAEEKEIRENKDTDGIVDDQEPIEYDEVDSDKDDEDPNYEPEDDSGDS
jgi:hypothetical protein